MHETLAILYTLAQTLLDWSESVWWLYWLGDSNDFLLADFSSGWKVCLSILLSIISLWSVVYCIHVINKWNMKGNIVNKVIACLWYLFSVLLGPGDNITDQLLVSGFASTRFDSIRCLRLFSWCARFTMNRFLRRFLRICEKYKEFSFLHTNNMHFIVRCYAFHSTILRISCTYICNSLD